MVEAVLQKLDKEVDYVEHNIVALERFVNDADAMSNIDHEPELLHLQLNVMKQYKAILDLRIKHLKVAKSNI